MNTETIRQQLRQHKTAVIALETGLSIATIDAIKSGRNQYPTTRTVEKLMAFLEKQNVENVDVTYCKKSQIKQRLN